MQSADCASPKGCDLAELLNCIGAATGVAGTALALLDFERKHVQQTVDAIGERFRPWRTLAAVYLYRSLGS